MIRFYRDEQKRYMVPGLFSQEARKTAERIRDNQELKSSQFRNYFQELRALEARYHAKLRQDPEAAWLELEPQLHLFKAKLAYGARKEGPLAKARFFREFLEETIDSIADGRDFEAALLYVEAVLAYFYAIEEERRNQARAARERSRR